MSIKYAVYLSGLGRYGINHLILTENLGPRVRMTAIVTDAPLMTGEPCGPLVEERCSSCLKCVAICPAGAFDKEGNMDREKCADYMFNSLGGLRCGLCVKVCPL
jgi:epoxyqueuosine reductase QueG